MSSSTTTATTSASSAQLRLLSQSVLASTVSRARTETAIKFCLKLVEEASCSTRSSRNKNPAPFFHAEAESLLARLAAVPIAESLSLSGFFSEEQVVRRGEASFGHLPAGAGAEGGGPQAATPSGLAGDGEEQHSQRHNAEDASLHHLDLEARVATMSRALDLVMIQETAQEEIETHEKVKTTADAVVDLHHSQRQDFQQVREEDQDYNWGSEFLLSRLATLALEDLKSAVRVLKELHDYTRLGRGSRSSCTRSKQPAGVGLGARGILNQDDCSVVETLVFFIGQILLLYRRTTKSSREMKMISFWGRRDEELLHHDEQMQNSSTPSRSSSVSLAFEIEEENALAEDTLRQCAAAMEVVAFAYAGTTGSGGASSGSAAAASSKTNKSSSFSSWSEETFSSVSQRLGKALLDGFEIRHEIETTDHAPAGLHNSVPRPRPRWVPSRSLFADQVWQLMAGRIVLVTTGMATQKNSSTSPERSEILSSTRSNHGNGTTKTLPFFTVGAVEQQHFSSITSSSPRTNKINLMSRNNGGRAGGAQQAEATKGKNLSWLATVENQLVFRPVLTSTTATEQEGTVAPVYKIPAPWQLVDKRGRTAATSEKSLLSLLHKVFSDEVLTKVVVPGDAPTCTRSGQFEEQLAPEQQVGDAAGRARAAPASGTTSTRHDTALFRNLRERCERHSYAVDVLLELFVQYYSTTIFDHVMQHDLQGEIRETAHHATGAEQGTTVDYNGFNNRWNIKKADSHQAQQIFSAYRDLARQVIYLQANPTPMLVQGTKLQSLFNFEDDGNKEQTQNCFSSSTSTRGQRRPTGMKQRLRWSCAISEDMARLGVYGICVTNYPVLLKCLANASEFQQFVKRLDETDAVEVQQPPFTAISSSVGARSDRNQVGEGRRDEKGIIKGDEHISRGRRPVVSSATTSSTSKTSKTPMVTPTATTTSSRGAREQLPQQSQQWSESEEMKKVDESRKPWKDEQELDLT
ncbi:unnamed protein product [Amoebophrya sp. A120]|nr:unnamed protein product [Amoebophrya sp. A120]|eukprot:GSA120T00000632001.1